MLCYCPFVTKYNYYFIKTDLFITKLKNLIVQLIVNIMFCVCVCFVAVYICLINYGEIKLCTWATSRGLQRFLKDIEGRGRLSSVPQALLSCLKI